MKHNTTYTNIFLVLAAICICLASIVLLNDSKPVVYSGANDTIQSGLNIHLTSITHFWN